MYQKTLVALSLFLFSATFALEFPESYAEVSVFRSFDASTGVNMNGQGVIHIFGWKWLGGFSLVCADLGEFEKTQGELSSYMSDSVAHGFWFSSNAKLSWVSRIARIGIFCQPNWQILEKEMFFETDLGLNWKQDWHLAETDLRLIWQDNKANVGLEIGKVWHWSGLHLLTRVGYESFGSIFQTALELQSYRREFKCAVIYRLSLESTIVTPFELRLSRRIGHWEGWFLFQPSQFAENSFSVGLRWYEKSLLKAFDFYE